MDTLIKVNIYLMTFFIFGLYLLILYQLLTGTINMKGLLKEKDESKSVGFSRFQLLLITVTGSAYYLMELIRNPQQGFPDVPFVFVVITGLSNGFYVWKKFQTLLVNPGKSE